MKTAFADFVLAQAGRMAMPIGVYAGLEATRASVRAAVSDPAAQVDAVLALRDRFQSSVLLTAMDLSPEADAFGCEIRMSDDEIPTVIGRRTTTLDEVRALPDAAPGDGRTAVHLEAARRLVRASSGAPVLACLLGPFSLAGRLFGVGEALEATALEPELVHALLEKATRFLTAYATAFRETGVAGCIMAEPAAGLLSPRGLGEFSAPYVRRIVEAVETRTFAILLHNCGAKLVHLPKVLESGTEICHFGAPMDIVAALGEVQGRVILGGNLDPAAVFLNATPESVYARTAELLAATAAHKNFILSSGCDIPPGTPLTSLDAFYAALGDFNAAQR
jgi:uroporphyrinogen decarboxylase